MKQTLKEALSEALHEERELLHEVFAEVLEEGISERCIGVLNSALPSARQHAVEYELQAANGDCALAQDCHGSYDGMELLSKP